MTRKLTAALAVLLLGHPDEGVGASQPFSARPAASNYAFAVDTGAGCARGVALRFLATGTITSVVPRCDSQQDFVATLKSKIEGLCGSFVDMSQTTGDTFDAYFAVMTNTTFPMLNTTALLARLSLPGSYLVVTPWRVLNGDSNDWDGLHAVMTNLVATAAYSSTVTNGTRYWVNAFTNNGVYGQWGGYYSGQSESTWEYICCDWCGDPTLHPCNCESEASGHTNDCHSEGQQISCDMLSVPWRTTGVTTYASVAYSQRCEMARSTWQSSWSTCAGSGDPSEWCEYREVGSGSEVFEITSKRMQGQYWSGYARAACASGLGAGVDFYDRTQANTGQRFITNTSTYATMASVSDCTNGIQWQTQSVVTNDVVLDLLHGITTSRYHRTQADVSKPPGDACVLVNVNYPLPAMLEYEAGHLETAYGDTLACACGCAVLQQTNTQTQYSTEEDACKYRYTLGYTPGPPLYLFKWDFDSE